MLGKRKNQDFLDLRKGRIVGERNGERERGYSARY